ncbi:hypothetical protein OK016_09895 [Vibrio chagasii]|nr:hypothetical protein [Vibrio chagasii]
MVFGIVLAIAVAIIAALLLSLQTQYRADVANFLSSTTVDQPVVIEDVEYQAPYHITLMGITYTQPEKQPPLYIDKVDLWFSPDSLIEAKLVLDSGINQWYPVGSERFRNALTTVNRTKLKLRQLAINNLDFSTNSFNEKARHRPTDRRANL